MKETQNNNTQVVDQFIKTDATEISMDNITTNIGIYFSNPANMLEESGWIKVYDDETDELLATFTKENWSSYNSANPFKYQKEVKHIRVETSSTKAETSLTVYNVKQLDDEYITTHYTKEEFDNLQYIKSTLTGYIGGEYINTDTHSAYYEAPHSIAQVSVNKRELSTQVTEKNMKITIRARGNENANQVKWLNGAFLLKLPEDTLDLKINAVSINNENVKVASYEKIEQEGIIYIKINTQNETPETYEIVIECELTPHPTATTKTRNIELYAYNENVTDYWKNLSQKDIYDVNDNLNKEEKIAYNKTAIDFISPNSLLTSQTITNFDSKNSIIVAPQIGEVTKKQKTANINIEISNNYSSTISDVIVLGRVPFEGNRYTINGNEMGSTITVSMTDKGIILPDSLKSIAKVYYSENGEATKDLEDSSNKWEEHPKDFSKVKSYLITLENHNLVKGEKHTFTYEIQLPENVQYNQVAYSHHAVYFSLDTEEGKYETQTEPNKVGIMVARKYDLELTKFQKGKEKNVAGATYSITEEGKEETKTRVTAENGSFTLRDLYVDKTYIIKEIKSPIDYELNTEEIKFRTWEENEELKTQIISGTAKSAQVLQSQGEEQAKVQIQVEDEVKANVKIIKTQQGSTNPLKYTRFKVSGKNFENGKVVITDPNGIATLKGLSLGEIYTIEEIKATEGYYLNSQIMKFTIQNSNGTYEINLVEGTVKAQEIVETDSIPTACFSIENEKIPTYNLVINKVVKDETTVIEGAKFTLYKDAKRIGTYTTDEQGKITINNLYQYEAEKNIEQTYTLKEVEAAEGYAPVKDITFKVEKNEGLLTMDVLEGIIKEQTAENDTLTITIEDSPSFKLMKKDGETKEILPNTKFAIYNVDNGIETLALDAKYNILGTKEVINGKEYYTLTTNETGSIEVPEASAVESEYAAMPETMAEVPEAIADVGAIEIPEAIAGTEESMAMPEGIGPAEVKEGMEGLGSEEVPEAMADAVPESGEIEAPEFTKEQIEAANPELVSEATQIEPPISEIGPSLEELPELMADAAPISMELPQEASGAFQQAALTPDPIPEIGAANGIMTPEDIAALLANTADPEPEPEPDPIPAPFMGNGDGMMSPEEIAALIGNTAVEELPKMANRIEDSIKPPLPDMSDPGKMLSPEDIASLIANM